MKKTFLFTLGLTFMVFAPIFYSCSNNSEKQDDTKAIVEQPTIEDTIKQGERLVTIMGCNDCHSPKKMGPQGPEIIADLMLSGYPSDRPIVKFDSKLIKEGFGMFYPDLTAAAGPWGVSFAGNLTPDESGIGNWTEEQFKRALTQGKLKGLENGRPLLPPMPWYNYTTLTDHEVHSIFSYLKSLKPVKNIVPSPITPDKM
jgi:mono/diheme cytochrome c family protein